MLLAGGACECLAALAVGGGLVLGPRVYRRLGLTAKQSAVLGFILITSLAAQLVFVLFELLPSVKASPLLIALVGAGYLVGLAGVAAKGLSYLDVSPSPTAVFFVVTACTAMVDLVLALAMLDVTVLGKFYLVSGEEYFKTGWGFWALAWDGTAHYLLQSFMALALLTGKPYRAAGLVWSGSIVNSMPVLLLGAAVGVYSAEIKPSTGLNAPYILAPLVILGQLLADSPGQPERKPAPLAARLAMLAYHCAAIGLHTWRALAVLGSQSPVALWLKQLDPILFDKSDPSHGFILVQVVQFFFYYMPFHAVAAFQCIAPEYTHQTLDKLRFADWALVFAGGYLQAQVTSVGAVAMAWHDFGAISWRWDRMSVGFWGLNVGLVLGAGLYAAQLGGWHVSVLEKSE